MTSIDHIQTTDKTSVLACKEINAQRGLPTILLILSRSKEWDLVTPHLQEGYHLLLPDLPGHGESKHITPFTKELSTTTLADLIRARALHTKAHIIGLSIGAHIAVDLISKYPELVGDVFLSGYEVFPWPRSFFAYAMWLDNRIESAVPRSVVGWLTDGADLEVSTAQGLSHSKAVADIMCIGDDEWPSPWPAKTLIVAAGKSGILPTADHPHDAKRLRDIGRQKNGETKAYTHPAMRHPWHRQAPELFAQTARNWFEGGTVPDGFVEL